MWLSSASEVIAHRGPDDFGEWWSKDGCVGLAHRRLSIIDLTDFAHQPMVLKKDHVAIVFNGEIYNYLELRKELADKGFEFISNSDTEVIIAAYLEWGISCVNRFVGMFAFALYDMQQNTLYLARDRAGEKPLYFYHQPGNSIRFSSELKSLLQDDSLDRNVDQESLSCYLAMGYIPNGKCVLNGFNKLPPANIIKFDLNSGSIKKWRYWSLPEYTGNTEHCVDEAHLEDELDFLLENSVKSQLVADVPVGILLSGGTDSSLVTAMAARCSNKLTTFTVRFPGHGSYDETEHARLIARHFETNHVELVAEVPSVDMLLTLAGQLDEPIADSSIIPTMLVSRLVREHCTVVLGGDGGDELFGGYGHYRRLLLMQKYLPWFPRVVRSYISDVAEQLLPIGTKGRNFIQWIGGYSKKTLPIIAPYFDSVSRLKLQSSSLNEYLCCEDMLKGSILPDMDILQMATRFDFNNYLAEDILVKIDRMSMLSSLEVRSPFLDHRIVEFAFSKVPSRLKVDFNNNKILLKRLARNSLPSGFDQKRKQGFSVPLSKWMKEKGWNDLLCDTLLYGDADWLDRRFVYSLIDDLNKGASVSDRLFNILMFELWRKHYKVSM